MIQWGYTDGTGTEVTFPTAFPSGMWTFATGATHTTSYNGCGYQNIKTGTITKTGFSWITKAGGISPRYIAIGY